MKVCPKVRQRWSQALSRKSVSVDGSRRALSIFRSSSSQMASLLLSSVAEAVFSVSQFSIFYLLLYGIWDRVHPVKFQLETSFRKKRYGGISFHLYIFETNWDSNLPSWLGWTRVYTPTSVVLGALGSQDSSSSFNRVGKRPVPPCLYFQKRKAARMEIWLVWTYYLKTRTDG
jgi:hypothetical protein